MAPVKNTTLVFDLDGTLVDSAGGIRKSFLAAFKELGLPIPEPEQIQIGPPIAQVLAPLLGPTAGHRFDEALITYRKHYAETGVYESPLFEGIAPLLKDASKAGFRLAVATAKLTAFAHTILDHHGISGCFSGRIFGTGPAGELSNKSELLKFVAGQLGAVRESSFMIGDRKFDIQAARNNGFQSIGVTWGYGSRDELSSAGAQTLVSSALELRQFLELS